MQSAVRSDRSSGRPTGRGEPNPRAVRPYQVGIARRAQIAVGSVAVALTLAGCGGQAVVQAGSAPVAETVAPEPSPGSAEMEAEHQAGWDAQMKRYAEWIASDFVQNLDLRELEQVSTLSDPASGYSSLAEAVDHADLAILGTVEGTAIVPHGIRTRFRVDRAAKGGAARSVTIHQWPTVWPEWDPVAQQPDYARASLTLNPEAPILFAGDRAVLLLEKPSQHPDAVAPDAFHIQNYSGCRLRSEDGRVRSVPDNRFPRRRRPHRGRADGPH